MFDRVVAALVVVVLMLFSATAALACSGCDYGTAQCLVSLDLQAEEVLSTDLEVFTSLDVELYVENAIAVSDYGMISDTTRFEEAMASGAAGVQFGTTATRANQRLAAATIGSGRFSGATS